MSITANTPVGVADLVKLAELVCESGAAYLTLRINGLVLHLHPGRLHSSPSERYFCFSAFVIALTRQSRLNGSVLMLRTRPDGQGFQLHVGLGTGVDDLATIWLPCEIVDIDSDLREPMFEWPSDVENAASPCLHVPLRKIVL